jgi:hypothetical protein
VTSPPLFHAFCDRCGRLITALEPEPECYGCRVAAHVLGLAPLVAEGERDVNGFIATPSMADIERLQRQIDSLSAVVTDLERRVGRD